MSELSPAAQAVMEAYRLASDGCYINGEWIQDHAGQVAAALRAAADQPYQVPVNIRDDDYWHYRAGVEAERNRNLAIAAELEAHHA